MERANRRACDCDEVGFRLHQVKHPSARELVQQTLFATLLAMWAASALFAQGVDEPGEENDPPVPVAVGAIGVAPNSYPTGNYYFSFAPYHDGQYAQAIQLLQNSQLTVRKVPGPWIDSICHHAMLGECYYQLGRLKEALTEYTSRSANQPGLSELARSSSICRSCRPVRSGPILHDALGTKSAPGRHSDTFPTPRRTWREISTIPRRSRVVESSGAAATQCECLRNRPRNLPGPASQS